MNNTSSHEDGIVGDVSRNLGAFFRHLLPGVFIVGAAYVAHPVWFSGMDTQSWQHLALAATVALASGNIWFALNRYGIHQLIDWLAYRTRSQGPVPESKVQYMDDLAKYVARSLMTERVPALARRHVAFRASSVLLIYTIAEVAFLFSCWHESGTLFEQHQILLIFASVVIFAAGVWQNVITRHIDCHVVVVGEKL